MIKVDSKKTLRDVSRGIMRVNRGRNTIAFFAVILTTVLFTTLFTSALSMIKSQQHQDMREAYNTSHIAVQFATEEQFEQIRQDEIVAKYGYTIFIGLAENEELLSSTTEVKYADANGAASMMCTPTVGKLPEQYNEVAMSTITLDLLGIPHELGSSVPLILTLDGKKQSCEFVLSGFWRGDALGNWQEVWLSEAFCLDRVRKATEESLETEDVQGGYQIRIWCDTPFGLQEKADALKGKYGLADTAVHVMVNPAWDLFAEDSFPFGEAALILLVIFASGYLIIYNVFYLSVHNDIRTYGLLKNVGATGKQLGKIVRRQALLLSVCGIPIGLLAGYAVGAKLTPYLLSGDVSGQQMETVLSVHPLIFLASAVFTLLTVWVGCIRPCRIVAKISPVQAVRMTETDRAGEGGKIVPGTGRSYGASGKRFRITPARMAFGNVRRSPKKAALVIVSIALPAVVLNAAWSIFQGFDFEEYVSSFCTFDFEVSNLTSTQTPLSLHAVTPQIAEALAAHEDVEELALLYISNAAHELTEAGCQNLEAILEEAGQKGTFSKSQLEEEAQLLEKRQVVSHILGINEAAFDRIADLEGACTYDQLSGGEFVVIGNCTRAGGEYYYPGDRVKLRFENGKEKEYTVAAVVDAPYDLGYPYGSGTWFDYTFYLAENEYCAMEGNQNASMAGLEVRKGSEKRFDRWLADYIADGEKTLIVKSQIALEKSCRGFAQRYYVILGLMCAVLFVICLLNFFNTSAVSLLSRSRELSLLEAVGMTQKQVKKMLIWEGIFYLAAAVLLADTAGTVLAQRAIEKTVGRIFFFNCRMTVAPSLMILPALLVILAAIPLYNYRKLRTRTVMERLQRQG